MMKVFLVLLSCTAIQGLKLKELADSIAEKSDQWMVDIQKWGNEARRNVAPNSLELKAWNFLGETQFADTCQEVLADPAVVHAVANCNNCEEPITKVVHKVMESGDLALTTEDYVRMEQEPALKDLMSAVKAAVEARPDQVQRYKSAMLEVHQSAEDSALSEPLQMTEVSASPKTKSGTAFGHDLRTLKGWVTLFVQVVLPAEYMMGSLTALSYATAYNPFGAFAALMLLIIVLLVIQLIENDHIRNPVV